MKSDNPLKHFVVAFAIALVFYAVAYQAIEHRRVRKGPWQVTFTEGPGGHPLVRIDQPTLAITNVQLHFPDDRASLTNAVRALDFATPRPVPYEVPFGRCVFMDTTFLPGTVTLQFFGHEIELLPRVLILDHREHPWRVNEQIELRSLPVPSIPQRPSVNQ